MAAPTATPVDTTFYMQVTRDGVFTAWGTGLEEIFGYTSSEILGQPVDVLIPPRLRSLHHRGFSRALETGSLKRQGKVVRSVGIHKDGHLVPFRAVDILEPGDDGAVASVGAVVMGHGWGSLPRHVAFPEP